MQGIGIKNLYYITHVNNLPSILKHGILSHNEVAIEQNIPYTPIYDKGIVTDRHSIKTPGGKSLWEFANLYFNARNPMLYRVICEKPRDEIAVLAIDPNILKRDEILITTGNARAYQSEILSQAEGLKRIDRIKEETNIEWWQAENGSKRKIMAECLVPDSVPPDLIQAIYVSSHNVAESIKAIHGNPGIPVIPEPHMFFLPSWRSRITHTLSLIDGDMFFSNMQTLTISVNTVGVMGKGLASRVKYQFPGVYVAYQDLCKSKKLRMGHPYLLKRETSMEHELADEPSDFTKQFEDLAFLLFPTKKHWRQKADIQGIAEGLNQVRKNYKRLDIKSLAVPALGCGLGWLRWERVGPLLARYLYDLDIQVAIYLPREVDLTEELKSTRFLLSQVKK